MAARARLPAGWWRRALSATGWCVLVGFAAVLGARLLAWDRWQPMVVADALSDFVFFPVLILALFALFSGRRVLALAACVVMIGQVVLIVPEISARQSIPAIRGDVALRLFDANVYEKNHSMAGFAAEINNNHPDLVTLEEATPADRSQLMAAGALESLPYEFDVPQDGSRAFLVASRYPLTDARVVAAEGQPFLVHADLTVSGRTISLWVVHTLAPVGAAWQQWSRQLSTTAQMLKADRARLMLVAGDFNATWGNRGFRRILSLGLTDAAAARGDPFQMTWSQTMPFLPPLIRIDHILTNHGTVVSHISALSGPGSDHRALIAEVALR